MGISLGGIYLIIGVIVAGFQGYLAQLGSGPGLLQALLVVLLWPLVLLGVPIHV